MRDGGKDLPRVPKTDFRFLTNDEFERLTQPEKFLYIALATERLEQMKAAATGTRHHPENRRKRRRSSTRTKVA